MKNQRHDIWTEKDDALLAETVLRKIREGSTQLAAFEEVGEQLGRTAAACGFRWNSTLRKKYSKEVAEAKSVRKADKGKSKVISMKTEEMKSTRNNHVPNNVSSGLDDFDKALDVIVNEFKRVKEENNQLRSQLEELQDIKKDFEYLMDVIRKIRRDSDQKDFSLPSASVS
jgi:prespore-specific regulator